MKKSKEYCLIFILIVILTSIIIPKELNDLDEIWNYNFAKNVVDGNMPYRDFNMIQMPLLPNICAIFLFVFGNELLIMRILAIVLCTAILFIAYKILKSLKVNEQLNYIFLIFLVYLFIEHFRIDYNFLVLLFLLIIIFIETNLINKKQTKACKTDIILGILAGLCICTKQTTGILISIVLVGYKLFDVTKKEEFKVFIIKAIYRVIGIIISLIILSIYFTVNNLWSGFIDYCILGVKTFSNYIPYMELIKSDKMQISLLSMVVPLFLVFTFIITIIKRKKENIENKNLRIISIYGIASISVAFPISDEIHFLIGAVPCMIGIVYALSLIKIKNDKAKIFINEFFKVFVLLVYIIIALRSAIIIYKYIREVNNYTYLNHFKYIPNYEGQNQSIKDIENYIESRTEKVYILDASAALYMIPIDRYNKNYDMFLKGNLGSKGEEGIINDLENDKNIIVLIKNEQYERNWQNPEEVRKYIINNMNKIGQIETYDIYEK